MTETGARNLVSLPFETRPQANAANFNPPRTVPSTPANPAAATAVWGASPNAKSTGTRAITTARSRTPSRLKNRARLTVATSPS